MNTKSGLPGKPSMKGKSGSDRGKEPGEKHSSGHKAQIDKQPLSDIMVRVAPRAIQTHRHSSGPVSNKPQIKLIPTFHDTPPTEHNAIFIQKLEQCCYICDFSPDTPQAAVVDRDTKTRYLKDMVGYVTNHRNVFPENTWAPIMKTVSVNIFRPLPISEKPPSLLTDADEDEPFLDPAWIHLQYIYELLFRFVLSTEVDPKAAVKLFPQEFIASIINLFDSEDARERDGLKSTLHRIYSRFWPRRPFIRNSIALKFHRFVFDQIPFNGIAELLEILGSIIHGFGVPVKQEHRDFCKATLLPLHSAPKISTFHIQLNNCMILYIEKDPTLAKPILESLIRHWPKVNSQKQILFLSEMEDIIDSLTLDDLIPIAPMIFKKIGECIASPHFQVAEIALTMLSNNYIISLISTLRPTIFPLLFNPLSQNTKTHWNNSVISLTFSALKLFMEMDQKLVGQCAAQYKKKQEQEHQLRLARDKQWDVVDKLAKSRSKGGYVEETGKTSPTPTSKPPSPQSSTASSARSTGATSSIQKRNSQPSVRTTQQSQPQPAVPTSSTHQTPQEETQKEVEKLKVSKPPSPHAAAPRRTPTQTPTSSTTTATRKPTKSVPSPAESPGTGSTVRPPSTGTSRSKTGSLHQTSLKK
ncbi:putative Serine/threonine-protein phosphatase 2A 56 kDa regulatory subunit gamma [Blattamonas nauphoetae]|uniref:Serine/threonine-protein phosphatase 2A 56 kDa regulatory subunit gamma n=1 Tax=Blattamonas nauphoetae TaxID=2049346 RepID=A0ABQ9X3I1_9EUKA|nr:putative Serine/threonine-protein phosphatase 2A 56 kDa regulatory subunit gamma [Blattamonas nauphoetae]